MISTTGLVANQVLPGDHIPPVQDLPASVLYDSVNGDLYVRGAEGTAVAVIDATTNVVVAAIALPASANPYSLAPTLLADPVNGDVYSMNYNAGNVSVIDAVTNTVTASIGSSLSPTSAVFDPDNGYIYLSDWSGDNVTIINTATNAVVVGIPVGSHPGPLVFDAASNELFVANTGSGNVSVIDTLTGAVVKNLPTGILASTPQVVALDTDDNLVDVGSQTTDNLSVINATTLSLSAHPYVPFDSDGLAYAPRQDELFVENGAEGNVSVFNQSENSRIVANISTGEDPEGIAFDPVDHDVYVANSETPNLTVIDPATNHIVASIWTNDGLVYSVAVDSESGNVFAASEGTYAGPPSISGHQANVTVVADGTNLPIASVPVEVYPVGVTFDPGNGELVAADPAGLDLYLLNPATGLSTGTAPTGYAWASVYDSITGDLWVLNRGSDNLTVLNPALHSVANLTPGPFPNAIAFDSANGNIYVTDSSAGDVWVFNGATHSFLTTIPITAGASLNAILYDPHNEGVYVADGTGDNLTIINGTSEKTVGSSPAGLAPLSLAFDSTNDTIWVANSGNFTVVSDATNKSVANVSDPYAYGRLAFDSATNVIYDAGNSESIVSGIGASNYSVLGMIYLGENEYSSGITYDPVNHDTYVSTADAGIISTIGRPVPTYPVQFVETGLPSGKAWSVTLNGTTNGSTTSVVGYQLSNYTYSYTIGAVVGYVANMTGGSVIVNGSGKTVNLHFTAVRVSYSVTFEETGLVVGTMWNVSVGGSPQSSTTSSIVFSEQNGTYSFTVSPVTGFAAVPSSGDLTVFGGPIDQNITFIAGTGALTATLTATPATITLGESSNFTTVTGGGAPPFEYVYTNLPTGCATADSPTLECTPTASGNSTVTVTVTDTDHHSAEANAKLIVQGSTSTSSPPASSTSWLWILLVVIVVAVLILVFLVVRRRRQGGTSTAAPPPSLPPPTSPPP
ncbi:MAG: YncE family protein [Thermoplasmata archaeon]|nr:YncE family protein [Thermoplasmata archaeon]